MSTIPSNLARIPFLMSQQMVLSNLHRTHIGLFHAQSQLATGLRVLRPSDDAIAASAASVLDDVIERRDQWIKNLNRADSVLNTLDHALGDASDLLIEAKGIGSSQIGIGSDADTRANQAKVIDAMLNEMFAIANRDYQNIHFFGGSATADPPMVSLLGGMRYQGQGTGLVTDQGQTRPIAVTVSGEEAFGALSARVQGNRDLEPILSGSTRLADLDGARGLGIALGSINVDVGGTDLTVDLSSAHTVQDVVTQLENEIRTVDPGAIVRIDPVTENRLEIIPGGGVTVTISDLTGPGTAADLGIDGSFSGPGGGTGGDLDPRLTELTALADLSGVAMPPGTIRLQNAGQVRDLDLSGATNVRDLMNAVRALDIGVRVEIAETGDRLDFINELSGSAMSIGEVGGGSTATELGVRTFATWTRLDDFNRGRGVDIVSGNVDPVTGLPDPARDLDFRIELKDGRTLEVDLAGAETVQDVIDAIDAAAAGGGIAVPIDFSVTLAGTGNGLTLTDNTVGAGTFTVTPLNGSRAAEQLGILGTSSGASLAGVDRAEVYVESVFTHLIDLRAALTGDDELGITLASERFEADIARLAEARADVGIRSRRVTDAIEREEDLRVQDINLLSEVRDLDYAEASIRFSTLQQQLQAGLLTASQVTQLSLLDFLG